MSMIANFLRVEMIELEEYKSNSELLEDRIYDTEIDNDPNFLDIEKAWDGIIFLLTGKNIQNATGDLLKVIFSGNLVDETQDLGYGPAHFLTSDEVKVLNNKIKSITDDEIKLRFNPEKMIETAVYPQIWDEGEAAFNYLNSNFIKLKKFYDLAADNNHAIITILK